MFHFLSLQWQQAQLIWNLYRTVVQVYFAAYEPDLVQEQKAQCLNRNHFWAAGVNNLFAIDQHDKWLRFGLTLHTGIEPFSGCY